MQEEACRRLSLASRRRRDRIQSAGISIQRGRERESFKEKKEKKKEGAMSLFKESFFFLSLFLLQPLAAFAGLLLLLASSVAFRSHAAADSSPSASPRDHGHPRTAN